MNQEQYSANILIVDDQEPNVRLLQKILSGAGYSNVIATTNPLEVEKLHREHDFDLVLLDIRMPEMDGFEATGVWREKEQTSSKRRLPIIAMTANVMAGDREKCLASGMDDYLGKPVRQAELGKVLQRWIK